MDSCKLAVKMRGSVVMAGGPGPAIQARTASLAAADQTDSRLLELLHYS